MAILFDFYESPPTEEKDNKPHVHARPVLSNTITTEELAVIIQERSSLTESDIYAALISLGRVMGDKLRDGQRVHLEGIGFFSVSLACKDIKTKKDMRANNVSVKSIQFRADAELKGDVMGATIKRAPARNITVRLSNEEVDRKVAQYFEEKQTMTRTDFQRLSGMKAGVAYRQIHRMLEEGKIKNINIKRQPIYVPVVRLPE